MFRRLWSRWIAAKTEAHPPMPNAHYLGVHIAEATSKAGYRWWR
tara:strand:+ start:2379 stop:2510 length:132 start_codon:yes stop_codon:yes gene_type:complete